MRIVHFFCLFPLCIALSLLTTAAIKCMLSFNSQVSKSVQPTEPVWKVRDAIPTFILHSFVAKNHLHNMQRSLPSAKQISQLNIPCGKFHSIWFFAPIVAGLWQVWSGHYITITNCQRTETVSSYIIPVRQLAHFKFDASRSTKSAKFIMSLSSPLIVQLIPIVSLFLMQLPFIL